jgi:NADP-dependent 3-hydroxy acid dehydrogenase YdfG
VKELSPAAEGSWAACRLAGRIGVATGASSGIGQAIAMRLVAEGATVNAVGRDKVRLGQLLASAIATGGPGGIIPAQVDLTDDGARRGLVAGLSAGPRVDLLIHSAGAYSRGDCVDAPIRDLDAPYASNVRAPYALIQELLPVLRAGGGDIILVNSTQGIRAAGGVGQYAATQHAMRAATDSLRQGGKCGRHLGVQYPPGQDGDPAPRGHLRPGGTAIRARVASQAGRRRRGSRGHPRPSGQRGSHGDPSPASEEELLMRLLARGEVGHTSKPRRSAVIGHGSSRCWSRSTNMELLRGDRVRANAKPKLRPVSPTGGAENPQLTPPLRTNIMQPEQNRWSLPTSWQADRRIIYLGAKPLQRRRLSL